MVKITKTINIKKKPLFMMIFYPDITRSIC